MNIIIFDFDRTLFDTNRYVADMCRELDISKEDLYASLGTCIQDNRIVKLRSDLGKYIFTDSLSCLSCAQDIFDVCILLTKSKYMIDYQQQQISDLCSKHNFDEVIITEQDKTKDLEKIIAIYEPSSITFVNDDVTENTNIKDMLANVVPDSTVVTIDNYTKEGFSIGDFLETMKS